MVTARLPALNFMESSRSIRGVPIWLQGSTTVRSGRGGEGRALLPVEHSLEYDAVAVEEQDLFPEFPAIVEEPCDYTGMREQARAF